MTFFPFASSPFADDGVAPDVAGQISGASSLTFTTSGSITVESEISGVSTLTFSPSGTMTGDAPASGASTLTFSPAGTVIGDAPASGVTNLTFTTSGTLTDPGSSADIAGASSLTFTVTGEMTTFATMSGASSLTFLPSGSLTGDQQQPAGGGAIIRTYETRRRLSEELETALAAMRRPQTRAKRKKALASATGALRDLVATIREMPANDTPVAVRDLEALMARGVEVEIGVITFADWRAMVAQRIAQAQAEIEAARLMIEEEEAAMFMLMAA